MVQQLPFPRIQVGEVKIQVKETRKHLKAHIRHQKPYHARWFTTFQVRTGCLTFWKVTRRGAFFVCTMCMPLRWEYPVWTFHPPKSPSLGLFAFLFPKKAWSLWELVGRSLSIPHSHRGFNCKAFSCRSRNPESPIAIHLHCLIPLVYG